jgi:uncharacterized protein
MESLVANHERELAGLCRRYRVQRLELFGSAAGGGFDSARSDLDFLVEFLPLADNEHADAYFGLRESLASLFARPVDLVMTAAIRNRYFLQHIAPTRTLLYAA